MAVLKKEIFKACFKAFLFLTLLVLNYFLYMDSAIKQYQRGRTTMAESITDADELQYPVFILCPQPGFKASSFEDFRNKSRCGSIGIENYLWKQECFRYGLANVSSIPDTYTSMSYNLENDWKIQVGLLKEGINWFPTLKIGTHDYFGVTIDTVPIRTTSALCYKVKPLNFEFGKSFLFQIFVFDNSLEKMNLYVAANNTWQGIIYGKWPKKAKSPVKIVGETSQKSINQYTVSLEMSDWTYLGGNANYSQCLSDKEMYGTGCISMFHPDSYKFENRKLCQYLQKHNDVDVEMKRNITRCLRQSKFTEYNSEVELVSMSTTASMSYKIVQFLVELKSNEVLVYEETFIIDEIGLLGNLGGLLGLFVGFSVFGYASILFDAIVDKICS